MGLQPGETRSGQKTFLWPSSWDPTWEGELCDHGCQGEVPLLSWQQQGHNSILPLLPCFTLVAMVVLPPAPGSACWVMQVARAWTESGPATALHPAPHWGHNLGGHVPSPMHHLGSLLLSTVSPMPPTTSTCHLCPLPSTSIHSPGGSCRHCSPPLLGCHMHMFLHMHVVPLASNHPPRSS